MSKNFDVLNFLNLTNQRLGKLFELGGYNPLPLDFCLTEEKIKERLTLSEMAEDVKFPDFVYQGKDAFKSKLKISLKNLKKLKKQNLSKKCSQDFAEKVKFYAEAREIVTKALLKESKSYRFDECSAYAEIFALDPIFCQFLNLFDKNFDFDLLEDDYYSAFEKFLKLKNEKEKKTSQKTTKILQENLIKTAKNETRMLKNEKSEKIKSEKPTKTKTENVAKKNNKKTTKKISRNFKINKNNRFLGEYYNDSSKQCFTLIWWANTLQGSQP